MALSLLKRSDADVVLAATTDDPEGLAECLSAQQPFRVDVFATFPGIGWALPSLQRGLKTIHIANGWFAAAPLEVAKALCDISNAQNSETTSDQERCLFSLANMLLAKLKLTNTSLGGNNWELLSGNRTI